MERTKMMGFLIIFNFTQSAFLSCWFKNVIDIARSSRSVEVLALLAKFMFGYIDSLFPLLFKLI